MSDIAWGILIGAPFSILIGMVIMSVIHTARKWGKPDEDNRLQLDELVGLPEHNRFDKKA